MTATIAIGRHAAIWCIEVTLMSHSWLILGGWVVLTGLGCPRVLFFSLLLKNLRQHPPPQFAVLKVTPKQECQLEEQTSYLCGVPLHHCKVSSSSFVWETLKVICFMPGWSATSIFRPMKWALFSPNSLVDSFLLEIGKADVWTTFQQQPPLQV